MINTNYNPDVLSCLANLSNDEVFTPPTLVNQLLDLLPNSIWQDENVTFLDPACKTGVFLREIAKRLIDGLKDKIPDEQERIDHIFSKQLYGIAITNLTALLTRRSLYCSKTANGQYSICESFSSADGNIKFERMNHKWENDCCKYCGAAKREYDREEALETHAYQLIHTDNPEEIFNMKFDVIIGNPPYQLSDGGNGASAKPIYQKFVQRAKQMNPRYLSMIIPSRWFAGGKGLDDFRDEMLNDNRLRIIHDYLDAGDCFSGVEIKGGICYFLWDRDNKGDCTVVSHEGTNITSTMERPLLEKGSDVFIRYNEAISIVKKIQVFQERSFAEIVSPRKPFGYASNYRDYEKHGSYPYWKIYAQREIGWLSRNVMIPRNEELIDKWKLFIPEAIGSGDIRTDWIKPIIGEPNTLCTETYLLIGPFNDETETKNAYSYTQTKFFHLLVGLKKITQHTTNKVYKFVPIQDFSKSWTDAELYKKYGLSENEIAFIESMVRSDIGA